PAGRKARDAVSRTAGRQHGPAQARAAGREPRGAGGIVRSGQEAAAHAEGARAGAESEARQTEKALLVLRDVRDRGGWRRDLRVRNPGRAGKRSGEEPEPTEA